MSHDNSAGLDKEKSDLGRLLDYYDIRIDELEKLKMNLPADKGLTLELKPPGSFASRLFGSKQQIERQLTALQDALRSERGDRVNHLIKMAPEEKQQTLTSYVEEWNRTRRDQKLAERAGKEKDMDASQEYAKDRIEAHREDMGSNSKDAPEGPQEPRDVRADFLENSSFTKMLRSDPTDVEKDDPTKEPEPDRD